MKKTMGSWLLVGMLVSVAAGQNRLRNGDFELDQDRDGRPDHWQAVGSARSVTQQLTLDAGIQGRFSGRLQCTQFQAVNSASHAMLCQLGVPVERGKWYRFSFQAKARSLESQIVSVALSDTATWKNGGLQDSFCPGADWTPYEFTFQATRDIGEKSRLQIWFASTGTLWLDEAQFVPIERVRRRPGRVIAPADPSRNEIPNASFEAGASGFGSAEADRITHWGGKMNRLFGTIDSDQAYHGRRSLRIDLNEENQPVSYFDYFSLYRTFIRAPLAANIGWLSVQPGRPYVFSVYAKADRPNTPARLAIREFEGRSFEKAVSLGPTWQRYWLAFTPTQPWCYVLAGPDLRESEASPDPPQTATVWLDALQLELRERPTRFVPREPLEFGIETDLARRVFDRAEPIPLQIRAVNATAEPQTLSLALTLTDFFDREVWQRQLNLKLPAEQAVQQELIVEPADELLGFLRLRARQISPVQPGRQGRMDQTDAPPSAGSASEPIEQTLRLAVIPEYNQSDSRFGMNHAYPWDDLLDLHRRAGLTWVRDWSLKWQDVEPTKDAFTFIETDYQIQRAREHGMNVLGLLAFPSSSWSSSMPEDQRSGDGYEQRRAVVARAPRRMEDFTRYVEQTVAHYRGRIEWFQVFNEPLFTQYALPRSAGYDGETYAAYVKAFSRAARRANPDCRILAGIGALSEGQIMEDFRRFFAAGGLEAIDAVDIHHYPRIRPPEFAEGLLENLHALMDEHGGRKPIWLTEYGYYGDDEPWAIPLPHSGFDKPLRDEVQQAAYAVRWNVIMLANGVEKIFYHAGTCAGINNDSLQGVFYEYGGQPHKIYAAQAVLSSRCTPSCLFVKKLSLGPGVKGYLFQDGKRLFAVVWAFHSEHATAVRITNDAIGREDLMGRRQAKRQFVPGEVPVYLTADQITVEPFEAGIESLPSTEAPATAPSGP